MAPNAATATPVPKPIRASRAHAKAATLLFAQRLINATRPQLATQQQAFARIPQKMTAPPATTATLVHKQIPAKPACAKAQTPWCVQRETLATWWALVIQERVFVHNPRHPTAQNASMATLAPKQTPAKWGAVREATLLPVQPWISVTVRVPATANQALVPTRNLWQAPLAATAMLAQHAIVAQKASAFRAPQRYATPKISATA